MFGRTNEKTRENWIKNLLMTIKPGSTILDAGAGELNNKKFCTHLKYVSQDFCEYKGTGDGKALQMNGWNTAGIDIISDIVDIPCEDESFDAILCTEVFEHIPNPIAAIKEFKRLLKPNGVLIITAPFCSLTHFAPYHFVSGLSKYWYERHLGEMGFVIAKIEPNGGWFDYIAQEVLRLPWIGRRYSNHLLGVLALIMSIPMMFIIFLMNKLDRGSSELLTFGWHVLANKVENN